jgi:hypothetical protein
VNFFMEDFDPQFNSPISQEWISGADAVRLLEIASA